MKKNISLFYTIIYFLIYFWGLTPNTAKACTSFAVYGNNIFYGLNLDWSNSELRFSIRQYQGYKYFQLDFLDGGNWLTSVGMNEFGYLTTFQVCDPRVNANIKDGENPMNFGTFYGNTIDNFTDVATVLDYLNSTNRRLVQTLDISLHSLVAGVNGQAAVVESGIDSNMITNIEDNFIVMTNFNNHRFWGREYYEVSGLGAFRYQTAYEYISSRVGNFSLEDAVETLNRSKQSSGGTRTRCSMVFDPVNGFIYIMLQRNFSRIYRISLSENTFETYSGFDNYFSEVINEEGITSSQISLLTDIGDHQSKNILQAIELYPNYPNPFNSTTTIRYSVPAIRPQNLVSLQLNVYDVSGKNVAELVNEKKYPGEYQIQFNALGLPSGIYYCTLKTNKIRKTIKLIYLK